MRSRPNLRREVLVPLDAFLDTYKFGANYYHAYKAALSYPETPDATIASMHDVSYRAVRTWRNGEKTPDNVAVEENVRELGLFPLTYGNQHFPQVNMLASWVTYSGRYDQKFRPVIYGRRTELYLFMEELQSLGITGEYDDELCGIKLTGNGATFGRILGCLDVNDRQMDTESELKLPPYVNNLMSWLKDGALKEGDKEVARRILSDFATVLFATKLTRNSQRSYGWFIDMPKKSDAAYAESEGRETVTLLNLALPGLGIDANRDLDFYTITSKNNSTNPSKKLTHPRIWLRDDMVVDMLQGHRDLFRFTPHVLIRHYDVLKRQRQLRPYIIRSLLLGAESLVENKPKRNLALDYKGMKRTEREQALLDALTKFHGDTKKVAKGLGISEGRVILEMQAHDMISDEEVRDILTRNLESHGGLVMRAANSLGISHYRYSNLLGREGIDYRQHRAPGK